MRSLNPGKWVFVILVHILPGALVFLLGLLVWHIRKEQAIHRISAELGAEAQHKTAN